MSAIWKDIQTWLQQPFDSSGSALNWVLFLGLIILAIGFWNLVLFDLSDI
jgi:hypothetical protein